MEQFTPYIRQQDIESVYGYRKRAFDHLKQNKVKTAFFAVIPDPDRSDELVCNAIVATRQIADQCKRSGIRPIFCFQIKDEDQDGIARALVPKSGQALCTILREIDAARSNEVWWQQLVYIVSEQRDEYLVGNDIALYQGMGLHEIRNRNLADPLGVLPDFYFSVLDLDGKFHDFQHMQFYARAKKENLRFVLFPRVISGSYYQDRITCKDCSEVHESICAHSPEFAHYVLDFEKIFGGLQPYDAVRMIEEEF